MMKNEFILFLNKLKISLAMFAGTCSMGSRLRDDLLIETNPNLENTMLKLKHDNHYTILFNIAGLTAMGLSVETHKKVYSYIEEVMNGDGLYEGASKETILEAYYDQEMAEAFGETWVHLIKRILEEGI
jgi:hypothetical protein